ncbi:MAG: hypothetical protein PVG49_12185 [Desulfobacteraceae bacterium]|jgi:hypothetical protein
MSEEFERLSQILSQRPVASMKRKIADVVSRKFGYSLSRVFQIHAEISGVQAEYHIVYDLDEVMAWLNEGENE